MERRYANQCQSIGARRQGTDARDPPRRFLTRAPDSPEKSATAYFFALHNNFATLDSKSSEQRHSALAQNSTKFAFLLILNGYFPANNLARRL